MPSEIEVRLRAEDLISYDTGGVSGISVGARIDPEWHKLILDILTVGKQIGQFPSNPTEFIRNAVVLYAKVLVKAGVLKDGVGLLDIKRRIEAQDFRRKQEEGRRRRIEMDQFADDTVTEVVRCVEKHHFKTAADRLSNFVNAMQIYQELEPELHEDVINFLVKNKVLSDCLEVLSRAGFEATIPGVNDEAKRPGAAV